MSSLDTLPTADPAALGFDADRLALIEVMVDDAVEARDLPGAVTIVLRHGEVVHAHAAGRLDVERETAVGMDSLFRMYSQTKPVAAVVLMSFFEENAFELNDPVSRWIPEFANRLVAIETPPHDRLRGAFPPMNVEPARRDIMIMDLMTMTSGLPAIGKLPAAYYPLLVRSSQGTGFMPGDTLINDPPRSYEEMVLAIADMPLYNHPGDLLNFGSGYGDHRDLHSLLTGNSFD
ncbi:MAG: serine hydrolase, partial [Chloroflexi bacterium]|nr:serine hydrolase [Chloroflexota bacterium]